MYFLQFSVSVSLPEFYFHVLCLFLVMNRDGGHFLTQ